MLGAIEAFRALRRSGFRPRRSLELILFTSEEPTRFGVGCLGSRLMSSALDPETADNMKDRENRTLSEIRAAAGFTGATVFGRTYQKSYAAFVELHIEQGPILEARGLDIGVVTAIAAPASLRVHVEGEGGHAGAVLMPERRDAFLAAAEVALAVEAAARGTGSIDSVGTVGVCDVFPGAINSVPSRATLGVDVRDIDGPGATRRWRDSNGVRRDCRPTSRSIAIETINADAPCQCAPAIIEAIAAAAAARGLRAASLISRAYHDSLFMSRVVPTGMIFIPCRGGVSHRPDEYASPDAIARGVAVLADTLAALASG